MTSPGTLYGRAVVYNTPTRIPTPHGAFNELVDPHALDAALASDADTTAVRDHERGRLLGRLHARTLRLTNASGGLDFSVTLPDTELGRETAELVARGDLRGCSFMFSIEGERWHDPITKAGIPTRVITKVGRLYDVAICTWPAYETTSVRVNRPGDTRAADGAAVQLAEKMRDVAMRDVARRNGLSLAASTTSRPALGPTCRTLPPAAAWCRENRVTVRYIGGRPDAHDAHRERNR